MANLDELLTHAGYESGFWRRMRAGTDPAAEHPEQSSAGRWSASFQLARRAAGFQPARRA